MVFRLALQINSGVIFETSQLNNGRLIGKQHEMLPLLLLVGFDLLLLRSSTVFDLLVLLMMAPPPPQDFGLVCSVYCYI
jgi:hypothetical protein